MDNLAGSQSPVADAAALVFGRYGKQFIFPILVVTVVSSIHADFLYIPRMFFALARDGLLPQSLASVNSGGTPALTLFLCTFANICLALTGTFNSLVAIAS